VRNLSASIIALLASIQATTASPVGRGPLMVTLSDCAVYGVSFNKPSLYQKPLSLVCQCDAPRDATRFPQ
jgi:hypothetical protein